MANEMFTQLPTVANATTSDIICAVQNNVSVQETLGQILALVPLFTTVAVSGTTQQMVTNTGYIPTNSALTTFTLPTTSAVGDNIEITGYGTGGWSIVEGTSQQIILGNKTTTATSGSVSSTNANDSINLRCVVANTIWTLRNAPQTAGFTIV